MNDLNSLNHFKEAKDVIELIKLNYNYDKHIRELSKVRDYIKEFEKEIGGLKRLKQAKNMSKNKRIEGLA